MIQVGAQVPDFTVSDHNGNSISLSNYKGQKVAVFFYPKASTPGCTAEACDLRDHHSALKAAGYVILGVSADTVAAQEKFATKYELPFPLLADVDKTVINVFGVWGPKKFMGKEYEGIHRTTFLLDEQGVVAHVIDKVKTKEHAAQILEA
ncbi:MAG: thioredoxin-dependent thiol peroxidase [Flavobacteriaceae bacterium]